MFGPKESVNKKDFFLGFFSGMAITAIVCLVVILLMQRSGGLTAKIAADAPVGGTVVSGSPDTADETKPAQPGTPLKVELADGDHVRGNPNASVTIVEYSDFQCPYCQGFHQTMEQVMKAYPDKVRWVYRHFPLEQIHPMARSAAVASECAAEQDKFWEFADQLYARQGELGAELYTELAQELKLNTSDFASCVKSGRHEQTVDQEFQSGIASGVQGTPGTFLNGKPLNGAVPFPTLQGLIEASL